MIKDDNYYQISGWMLNRLGLKGVALSVYAIIYGFTQDGDTEFSGSRQYLADFTGTTRPTIDKALKELIEKGYISKKIVTINNVNFNKYKVILPIIQGVKKLDRGCKETLQGYKETLHNNNIYNNSNNNSIIYIVDYLNEKAKTNYKTTTEKTKRLINARLNEKFTVEDFKTVIDNKVTEWKGTDFEKYLRPETLFGTKFESYLNAKAINKNKPVQNTQIKKTESYGGER